MEKWAKNKVEIPVIPNPCTIYLHLGKSKATALDVHGGRLIKLRGCTNCEDGLEWPTEDSGKA